MDTSRRRDGRSRQLLADVVAEHRHRAAASSSWSTRNGRGHRMPDLEYIGPRHHRKRAAVNGVRLSRRILQLGDHLGDQKHSARDIAHSS